MSPMATATGAYPVGQFEAEKNFTGLEGSCSRTETLRAGGIDARDGVDNRKIDLAISIEVGCDYTHGSLGTA